MLEILLTMMKIGLFTFGGGYAMISIIEHEVITRRGWISKGDFVDLLTIAQSSPGPISLNTAVFVGYKRRGFAGALAAVFGVIVPSFVIILAVAMFFSNMRDNAIVDAAFRGMRPAVVALIIAPIIGLTRGMRGVGMAVAAAVAVAVWYFGISPVWFLLSGAVVGCLYAMVRGKEAQR